jgi:hypothetical protein
VIKSDSLTAWATVIHSPATYQYIPNLFAIVRDLALFFAHSLALPDLVSDQLFSFGGAA